MMTAWRKTVTLKCTTKLVIPSLHAVVSIMYNLELLKTLAFSISVIHGTSIRFLWWPHILNHSQKPAGENVNENFINIEILKIILALFKAINNIKILSKVKILNNKHTFCNKFYNNNKVNI